MYKNDDIKKVKFSDLDLNDSFFNSLRRDYQGFDSWFLKKSENCTDAYALFNSDGHLQAFLYLKEEFEEDSTITPKLPRAKKLKIGTFKIDAHRTSLSQRFITIILRKMIEENFQYTYVTFYSKQKELKSLFEKYGFVKWGTKSAEEVYCKTLNVKNDIFKDFPRIIDTKETNKFLLGIIPKYHTKLFPDSKLCNEGHYHRKDVSFSNTISKCYLGSMKEMRKIKSHDLIVIYRTNSGQNGPAYYRSVVTSVCTVTSTSNINKFKNFEEFKNYVGYGTIFTDFELKKFYRNDRYPYIIKMIYNFPLVKRIINGDLKDKLNINPSYWGCAQLTDQQFYEILQSGEVNENFIIH